MDVEVRLNLGPQTLAAELSPDGYCYDQAAILHLIRRACENRPDHPRAWKLLERLQRHGRLGLADLCVLAELGAPAEEPPVSHLLRGLLGLLLLWPALFLSPARKLLVDLGRMAVSPHRFAREGRIDWRSFLRGLYRFMVCDDLGRAQVVLATTTLLVYAIGLAVALWIPEQAVLIR